MIWFIGRAGLILCFLFAILPQGYSNPLPVNFFSISRAGRLGPPSFGSNGLGKGQPSKLSRARYIINGLVSAINFTLQRFPHPSATSRVCVERQIGAGALLVLPCEALRQGHVEFLPD